MSVVFNPYDGVNFADVVRVNSISHEHIFNQERFARAYNRGIRHFCCLHYQPATPRFPFSGWRTVYKDYTSLEDLTLEDKVNSGGVASFVDKNGNTIYTDDLPQVPNAEHPCFSGAGMHFNVIGSVFPDAGYGTFGTTAWRLEHPLYNISQIPALFGDPDMKHFGKIFGTINHNTSITQAKKVISAGGGIFQGYEIFNQGYTRSVNRTFREVYDNLLSQGYRLFCLSVVDWQGDIASAGMPGEDMEHYVPEVDFDRGCNVLLFGADYESLPANCFDKDNYVYSKAEAGLDAYITGRYYASGLGVHYITGLDVRIGGVDISFDSPADVTAITNRGKKEFTNASSVSAQIDPDVTYLRFEARFPDYDFIYTNPIWFDGKDGGGSAQKLLIVLN